MATRLRRSTKQNQYRITDDDSDDDDYSVDKTENKPPSALASSSSRKSHGGVLAVLNDNGAKATNKVVRTKSKNGKAQAKSNKQSNGTNKKSSITTKTFLPPCTPPTSARKSTNHQNESDWSDAGCESTPKRLFDDSTDGKKFEEQSATAAAATVGGMTPPPKSVLIAKLPSATLVSPPTNLGVFSSTSRVVSEEVIENTDARDDDDDDDDDVSAMSCSVDSITSNENEKKRTRKKYQRKKKSPTTQQGRKSTGFEKRERAGTWEYCADDEAIPEPEYKNNETDDDDATIPIEGQRSYRGDPQEEDGSYNDPESCGSDDDEDSESNINSCSEQEEEEEDSYNSESEIESDEDFEEEEEEEYVPDDDESASDDDYLEFDVEEKPAPRKTRRAAQQKKAKSSKPKTIDQDEVDVSVVKDEVEPQDDDNPVFGSESSIASDPAPEPSEESNLDIAKNPSIEGSESISSSSQMANAIKTVEAISSSKADRLVSQFESDGTSSSESGVKVQTTSCLTASEQRFESPQTSKDELMKVSSSVLGESTSIMSPDATFQPPESPMAVVLDEDDDEDEIVEAIILDDASQCNDNAAEQSKETLDLQSADNDSHESAFVDAVETDIESQNERGDVADDSMLTVEESVTGIVGMVVLSKQNDTSSPEQHDDIMNSAYCERRSSAVDFDFAASIGNEDCIKSVELEQPSRLSPEKEEIEEGLGATVKKNDAATKVPAEKALDLKISEGVTTESFSTPAKQKNRATKKKVCRVEGIVKRDKWTLGSQIGAGSFGVVHIGMNTATGTLMAVKTFKMEPSIMEDVRREIELMRSLDHPNIVRYYGAQRNKKSLHIFQEWVPAGSVASMLRKFGPFGLCVIRRYLSQTLSGLAYLHENNIMHRDIKGSNILVNDEGIVKLADFGASKKLANFQYDLMMSMTVRGSKLDFCVFF